MQLITVDSSDATRLRVAAFLGLPIGLGMIGGLVAPGRRGWGGLMAGLVCAATLLGVAGAVLEPHDPYAHKGWMWVNIVGLSVWWTFGASVGFAVVSVARRLRRW